MFIICFMSFSGAPVERFVLYWNVSLMILYILFMQPLSSLCLKQADLGPVSLRASPLEPPSDWLVSDRLLRAIYLLILFLVFGILF